jgi:aryl-alcohol dehydrogenase-like predicted oxidoreductase
MAMQMTRRDFAAFAGGFLVSTRAVAQTETPLLTPAIPGSGEQIPAVGLGTAYVFDANNDATRSKAGAVVQALVKNGGRLIDTASTYGDAESVLGEVTRTAGLRDELFIATGDLRQIVGGSRDPSGTSAGGRRSQCGGFPHS